MSVDLERVRGAANARVGREISGKYQLRSLLGCGGTAAVYLGWNAAVEREFAVKVLHGEHRENVEIVERFKREAYTANRVRIEDQSHPNVVDILDAGESDGSLYLVQELLKGQTLAEYLDALPGRRMDLLAAIAILRPIIHACAAGHQVGVIHRDIKPENIFLVDRTHLDKPALPKLLDFGIAQLVEGRMTSIESINGTPAYLPPEGYTDPHTIDARLDVWALGLTLYEMLSGSNPFDSEDGSWYAHASAVQSVAPPSLASVFVPGTVRGVIRRCMSKDPLQRYADAGELLKALDAALEPLRMFEFEPGETFVRAIVRLTTGHAGVPWNGLKIQTPPWPTADEIVEILALPAFASLRSLILSDGTAESEARPRARISTASADRPSRGDRVVEALSSSPHLNSLVVLEISGAGMSSMGAEKLAAGGPFAGLVRLQLARNALGDGGALALVRGKNVGEIEQLSLAQNALTDESANALATCDTAGALAELDVSGNDITDFGARALASSASLAALKTVYFDGNPLSAECCGWLRELPARVFIV